MATNVMVAALNPSSKWIQVDQFLAAPSGKLIQGMIFRCNVLGQCLVTQERMRLA